MTKPRTQLARCPSTSIKPRPRIRFSPTDRPNIAPQYTLTHTDLGEFALHWTAHWLAGLFCTTDFPAHWIAFVRASIHGPAHEATWPASALGSAPFAGATWISSYNDELVRNWNSPPQLFPPPTLPALPP